MTYENLNRKNFPKTFLTAVIIGLVSLVAGLLFNTVNPDKLPLDYRQIVESEEATQDNGVAMKSCEPIPIVIEEAYEYFQSGEAIFIDPRFPHEYNAGHIQGAINIPLDRAFPEFRKLQDQLPIDGTYIFYCDEGCDSSMELAYFFCGKGYEDGKVLVSEESFEFWKEMGFPVEPSD